VLIYLGFSAVAVFLAALVLLHTGGTSVAAVAHLVFTVAVVPLIFAAISHFIPVLTRSRAAPRGVLLLPLLLQAAGVVTFLAFRGSLPESAVYAAASITLLVALLFSGWMILRARRTLGRAHPGWRWYLLAIVFLAAALLLIPAMNGWPQARPQLRLLHLHLNTLGFIGLTALGSLQVLLPTALRTPDPTAAQRLRRQLPFAAGAVLAVAFGAAFWPPLSLAGALVLLAITLQIASACLRRHSWQILSANGAAAALFAALAGFALLLILGSAHAFALGNGGDAVPAFVVAFLLPLVSGALSELFPVWYLPGRRTPARDRMHAELRCGGTLRAILLLVGGALLALGMDDGLWFAALALLSFMFALLRSLATAGARRTTQ
jgi:hypothetical protein